MYQYNVRYLVQSRFTLALMAFHSKNNLIQSITPIFAPIKHMQLRKHLSIILASAFFGTLVLGDANAQISKSDLAGQQNVITTMVPFLTITPDSRSAGLGDAGVAMMNPDANSVSWNMSNLIHAQKKSGMSLSYAPWLRQLVNDIGFSYLSAYGKMGKNSVIGGSFRYFSLGKIQFTDFEGEPLGSFNPAEFAFDGGYATAFNKKFSMGVNLRFIYSNIAGTRILNGISTKPGVSFAGDINLTYKTKIKIKDKNADFTFGTNIQNIGSKMTYTVREERDFIPTNLKIGGALGYTIDEYQKVNFLLDINKLLVPTRPYTIKGSKGQDSIVGGRSTDVSPLQGMIQSFTDAPGGLREELKEYNLSFGLEYWYAQKFAGRFGMFYEPKTKGGRQYLTFGLGFRYNQLGIDAAYLVPLQNRHPLQNQLRFTLVFDFGSFTEEKN